MLNYITGRSQPAGLNLEPLTIITKASILDVAAVLGPPLILITSLFFQNLIWKLIIL